VGEKVLRLTYSLHNETVRILSRKRTVVRLPLGKSLISNGFCRI
jgi:hypothetical protein